MVKRLLFYSLLFIFSLLSGFIVLEAGLRVLDRSPSQTTWLEYHERGFLTNMPNMNALDSHRNNRVRYQLSSLRTRGAVPDPGNFNIWMFGDSFTFGLLLNEEDTFIERMNHKAEADSCLDKVRFINAGVGATGLSNWPAWLEVFGDGLPMDALFYVHNYDDMVRSFWSNLYVLEGEELLPSLRWIERPLKQRLDRSRSWFWLRENFRTFTMLQTLMWRSILFEDITESMNPAFLQPPALETMEEWVEYTTSLSRELYKYSLDLAVEFGVPLWAGTTGWVSEPNLTYGNSAVFASLPETLAEFEIPFFDISAAMYKRLSGDYKQVTIPEGTHPSAEGTRLIAELLWGDFEPFLREYLGCK